MILLIFTVCSLSMPERCETTRLQLADMTMLGCTMSAQPLLAQWVGEHPDAEVKRWRCAYPEREGDPT